MANKNKRLRYYNGLFLKAEDFTLDQDYHIHMRRTHNRVLHTWGIIEGLEVNVCPELKVKVSGGMALSSETLDGKKVCREISVDDFTPGNPADLSSYKTGDSIYITVSYDERKLSEEGEEGDEGVEGNEKYVWECGKISHSTTRPPEPGKNLILARVVREPGNKLCVYDTDADETLLRTYAGAVGGGMRFRIDGMEANAPYIAGIKDNARNGLNIASDFTSIKGDLGVVGGVVIDGPTVTIGSNPIQFNSEHNGYVNNADNRAEISNDTVQYKTLMILGNKSSGEGIRKVSVWDRLEVNGNLTVSKGGSGVSKGGLTVTGGLIDAKNGLMVAGGLTVSSGNLNVGTGNLIVNTGALTVANGLTVSNGNLNVGTGNLIVNTGALTVANGNLTVSKGDLTVSKGGLTVANGLTVSGGNLTVSAGGLTVTTGAIEAKKGLTVSSGDLNVSTGGLTVTGGLIEAKNGLTVSSGDLTVNTGGLTVVGGLIEAKGGLTVSNGDLTVAGKLNVAGGIKAGGSMEAANGLTVSNGDLTVAGKLNVAGSIKTGAKLDVTGDITCNNIQAANIVYGSVNANGTRASGNEFMVSKVSAGLYEITFFKLFISPPAVIATQFNSEGSNTLDNAVVVAVVVNAQKCRIKTVYSNGGAVDLNFHFIAIGRLNIFSGGLTL